MRKKEPISASREKRGSAILEAALVLLPLLAIGFALLDFSLAIFLQNTIRNAAREGVRFAITQQTGAGGQDAAIKTAVQNNSMGFINSTQLTANPPGATITVQYYDPATLTLQTGTGSNAGGNICVVTVTLNRAWMAPLWRNTGLMTFSAASSDVMEAPPNGVIPAR
jgi:Flp pilus assembly protein TadG